MSVKTSSMGLFKKSFYIIILLLVMYWMILHVSITSVAKTPVYISCHNCREISVVVSSNNESRILQYNNQTRLEESEGIIEFKLLKPDITLTSIRLSPYFRVFNATGINRIIIEERNVSTGIKLVVMKASNTSNNLINIVAKRCIFQPVPAIKIIIAISRHLVSPNSIKSFYILEKSCCEHNLYYVPAHMIRVDLDKNTTIITYPCNVPLNYAFTENKILGIFILNENTAYLILANGSRIISSIGKDRINSSVVITPSSHTNQPYPTITTTIGYNETGYKLIGGATEIGINRSFKSTNKGRWFLYTGITLMTVSLLLYLIGRMNRKNTY